MNLYGLVVGSGLDPQGADDSIGSRGLVQNAHVNRIRARARLKSWVDCQERSFGRAGREQRQSEKKGSHGSSLHLEAAGDHVHGAGEPDDARLLRRKGDLDRLVEWKRLGETELLKDDVGRAGLLD